MQRDTLPLSPLLPIEPEWRELATEASRAWFALQRVQDAVAHQEADGKDYWGAYNRMAKAASVISSWSSEPELYGRLLAEERILRDWGENIVLEMRSGKRTREELEGRYPPVCPNVSNNTPHADCCEQCRYELCL